MQEKQETQVQSLGQEDLLEKEMATYCSVLAWKIPWTEKPGRLTVHGVTKSQTRLSTRTHTLLLSFNSLKLAVYTNAITSVSTFYSYLLGRFMPSVTYIYL